MTYTTSEIPVGNDDVYVLSVEGTVVYSSTDGRALRVRVQNKRSGTYYG